MFGVNHSKLKTNLKVAIQRLKLLEKKKTENARKYTKEIAEFIQIGKIDRARIKVEHIIREDYMIESMEIVEMYCDLLLARFGLVESMKELDLGLYECVASLIWVASRLESECAELRVISECLASKYGKEFALMCKANSNNKVNERLMMKMSEQAPGELLVEKYLVEIAKSHNVPFKPNPDIAIRDPEFFFERNSNDKNRRNGGGGGASEVDDSPSKSADPAEQQVSHIGFHVPRYEPADRNKSDLSASRDIIFPIVPEVTDFTRSGNRPADNDQTHDSFDDLTNRFNQLKKN